MENETQTVSSELVQLVQGSGLKEEKQKQIAETLGQFFNKAAEWNATIATIVITSPEETGKMKMAREGRLTLRGMRLDAEKVINGKRDEVKFRMADDVLEDKLWLKALQMMQATFKNLETKLEEKETFGIRWEAEQKEKRTSERLLKLSEYSENDYQSDKSIVENLSDEAFENYLQTVKKMAEDKKAEAARIEHERIETERKNTLRNSRRNALMDVWSFLSEDEKNRDLSDLTDDEFQLIQKTGETLKQKDAEEKETQRLENERLKAANEELQRLEAVKTERQNKLIKLGLVFDGENFIYKDVNFHWSETLTLTDEEFTNAFEKARIRMVILREDEQAEVDKAEKERKEREAETARKALVEKNRLAKEKEENEKKLALKQKEIDDANAKSEALLKEKNEKEAAEELAEKKRIADEKKLAKAPEKEKLTALANMYQMVKFPVLETDEGKEVLLNIIALNRKLIEYIRTKANEL